MLMLLISVLVAISGCYGITEYFITESCNVTIGPTYGDVLRFDTDSAQDAWVIPGTNLDCYFKFTGFVAEGNTSQRYATLHWRTDNHYFAGYGWHSASSGCDTAYVEIYNASEIGVIDSRLLGPICGTEIPAEVTVTSSILMVHVYVEAPPEGTYDSSIVANDARFTVLPSCANTSSANASSVNETVPANVTSDANCTSQYGPFINFTVDFTSYFIGDCSEDNIDDEEQFQCDPGTNRCIAKSLRCDILYSNNCGDSGDVRAGPPGNCTYEVTTETPHTETSDSGIDDLLPLWIILGILAGLLFMYWCCWRPGYLPWRLARLRNVRCCQSLCQGCRRAACCQRCVGGAACGATGCCVKCQSCTKTGSSYPHSHPQYNLHQQNKGSTGEKVGGQQGGGKSATLPPNWIKFANDDGAHIREMR